MTTDTLDLPEIKPDMVAPPAAVEQTTAITEGMTAVKGEIAKFDQIAAGLAEIEKAHPKDVIVADIGTKPGMDRALTAWRAYRNPRLAVEKARKAAKAPLLALGKAIDNFAGGLESRLQAGEDHYKAQIAAQEQREEQRKAEIREHIKTICGYLERCRADDMTAARVANGMAALEQLVIDKATYQEFEKEANEARAETLAGMQRLHEQLTAREAEAARQEAIRKENERIAKELAEAQARINAEAAELRRRAAELAAAEEAARAAALAAEQDSTKLAPTGEWKAVTPGTGNAEAAPESWVDEDPDAATGLPGEPTEKPDRTLDELPPLVEPHAGLMLQDVDPGLSKALASKPDAMQHAREAAAAIAPAVTNPVEIREAFEADDTPPEPKPRPMVTLVATPDMAERVLTSPLKLAQDLEHAHALLREALGLVEHATAAFSGRFPTHPKPDQAWWNELRERTGALQPKLLMTLAQKREAA